MYTSEIQYVLDHGIWIRNLQAKVCAKDQLPRQNPSHVKAYIVNAERSNKAGEHWIAVIFNNNGNVLYFDSYGLPLLETEIINFLDNQTIILRRGDTIDNVFKVYRVKFVDFTVSSHWMLLLEATIYRNIFNKNSFQRIIIETIEMYPCGLINNMEIYTMKSLRLSTYSKNGHHLNIILLSVF